MSNRQLEELNEEKADKHIANLLGISVEDYNQLIHKGIQDKYKLTAFALVNVHFK